MKIKFSKELRKYTSFTNEIIVDGYTVWQGVEAVLKKFPQLHIFLVANNGEESNKTSLKLNDKYLFNTEDVWESVSENDVLEFGREVPEGAGGVGKIIAGVVLAVVGTVVMALTGQWEFAPYVYSTAASLVIGGTAELIIGTPKLPTFDSGSSTSSTYTFSGIKNTTTPGTPINIVYGKHRVGGHILDAYTETIGLDTFLNAQIGLSEGEISSISPDSIKFNDKRISDLPKSDVTITHRSGTASQEAPPKAIVDPTESITKIPVNIYAEDWFDDHFIYTPQTGGRAYDRVVLYFGVNARKTTSADGLGGVLYYKPVGAPDSDYKKLNDFRYGANEGLPPMQNVCNSVGFEPGLYTFKIAFPSPGGSAGKLRINVYFDYFGVVTKNTTEPDKYPAMHKFNEIKNTITTNQRIPYADSTQSPDVFEGTVYTTSIAVHSLTLQISAPTLSKNNSVAEVPIKIYIKKYDGLDTYVNNEEYSISTTIAGKFKSEYSIDVPVKLPDYAVYSIKVIRTTKTDEGDLFTIDDVYLKSVSEKVSSGLIYPHTALLGVTVKASDFLSGGMPIITSIVDGIKVKVPLGYDGTKRWQDPAVQWNRTFKAEKEWTNNPVWCLYDLLTNDRYGLANYYTISPEKEWLMLDNFYLMAQYCDTRLKNDGTIITDINDVLWDSSRPRFSLDMVIDEAKSVPDIIGSICGVMRASWYYSEGLIWLDIDRKKNITQIFNMSNIKDFVQNGISHRSIPNSYEVQFIDKEKDYDQNVLLVESSKLQETYQLEERKRTLQLIGVTDYRQAQALAKYTLLAGEKLLTTITFKTGTHGILSTIGDVIGVQHDVPQWGYGGKVIGYNSSTLTISLSDSVTFNSDSDYSIILSKNSLEPVTMQLDNPGNIISSIVVLSASPEITPSVGDYYVIGETSNIIKPFKVISLTRDSDEFVEVTCVEYNEDIYDESDNILTAGIIEDTSFSMLSPPLFVSVTNFKVEERAYTDSSGTIKLGVDCYYTIPNQLGWRGVVIYYGLYGTSTYTTLPMDNTGHVFIPEVSISGRYQFVACSVYKDGTQQSINQALNDAVNMPFTDITLTASLSNTVMLGGISGLQIDGQGNNTEFLGKDVKFTWRKPQLLDSLTGLPAGAEINGAGSGSSSDWLRNYKIEVLSSSGSIRRTDKAFTEEYTYTYIQNHADGIARNFKFRVCAVDKLGREGAWSTIEVSNPSPAAVTGVTLTAFNDSVAINFTPSSEIDVSHYLVYASQSNGFSPAENLLVNRGPETSFILPVTLFGTWYVRVAAVDSFGENGLNYTEQYSVYVSAPQVLPDELYTTLRTDFWVRDSIFNFSPAGSASTTLTWTAGSIIRNDTVYTLSQGTLASAHNSYIIATLSGGAATISKAAFGTVPSLNANQVIIAVTSSAPSNGTNNYLCYMRQANSMEMDGAIIRQATIGTLQVQDAAITQAKVTGLVVGEDGISIGGTYIDQNNVATFNVYAENIYGNTITGKTLQTSSDVNAKRFVVSSADGEAHFFANRGDGTIEELLTLGLSQVLTDYILIKSGSANTSNMAFRGETKGGVTTEIVNNGTLTVNVGIRVYVPGDTGATYGIRSDVQSNGIGVLGQAGSSGSYNTGTGVCATGSYLGADFNSGSAGAIKLGSRTSDPVSSTNGAVYYNSSTHKFRKNVNGVWADF